jgi:hypothetical protein
MRQDYWVGVFVGGELVRVSGSLTYPQAVHYAYRLQGQVTNTVAVVQLV